MNPSKTWWIDRGVEGELRILEKFVLYKMQSLVIGGELAPGIEYAKTLAEVHKQIERLIELSTADQN